MSDKAFDFIKFILKTDPKERPTLEQIEKHPWLDQLQN